MDKLETTVVDIHKCLLNGDIAIDDLLRYKRDLKTFAYKIIDSGGNGVTISAIKSLILICLDFYTFTSTGEFIITDSEYDTVMRVYMHKNKSQAIVYPDYFPVSNKTTWTLEKHTVPFMVGSIYKVYSYDDLYDKLDHIVPRFKNHPMIVLAPKYDGISVSIDISIEIIAGEIVVNIIKALTRKDSVYGQNITELVCNANLDILYSYLKKICKNVYDMKETHAKCELLMSTEDFNTLSKDRKYKNRRAAASAIVSTPSNIKYAHYITVMPLLIAVNVGRGYQFFYAPLDSQILSDEISNKELKRKIGDLMNTIRDPNYKYRIDGVVINVIDPNFIWVPDDAMENSVAYKINTKKGVTQIVEGYMSIGRTGRATPMLTVKPCDVNETTVTSVSISNMDKANKLDLCENDMIEVESAGDVIPMVTRVIKHVSSNRIRFGRKCPFCGSTLTPKNTKDGKSVDLYCQNPHCVRKCTGMITNFFVKLKAKNISDATIEDIFDHTGYTKISDYFNIDEQDMAAWENWGTTSAANYAREIKRLMSVPITHGTFIGAFGIDGIATKRCRAIMRNVKFDYLIKLAKKQNYEDIVDEIMCIDGFSSSTAKKFADFIVDNYDTIIDTAKLFTLKYDLPAVGTIVFTGFDDSDSSYDFESLGYEMSETVNSDTVLVFSSDKSSKKSKAALELGIPVLSPTYIPDVIDAIVDGYTPKDLVKRFGMFN